MSFSLLNLLADSQALAPSLDQKSNRADKNLSSCGKSTLTNAETKHKLTNTMHSDKL